MKYLLFSLLILMTGCGHYSDGTSVWAGGLFIIPLLEIGGIIVFGGLAYKSWTSGSTGPGGRDPSAKRVPITSIGFFWFAVMLTLALIATIWLVNADK
jgi:hypothetical protein